MSPKKIHRNSIVGERGVNLIQRIVLEMGHMWYATGGVEAGIDGFIEIRDATSGEVTNFVVQVQSKAGPSFFRSETETSFEFRCDEKDLDYWLQGNAPVILVVSRPESDEAYWVSIKDYFRDPKTRATRKVRFDKDRDRFDESCRAEITRLAVPKDAGLYFAPPPKQETLHSNLLRVSHFPERLYVARTDYRTGQEVQAKLREMDVRGENEWFAKYKSILSFNDLSEWPWDHICEQGTVEAFDSEEWAYSEDLDVRGDFVQLLNRCLSAKAYALGLRYDKDRHCHYFKATKKLVDRKLSYKSVVNETTRTVVKRYTKKDNPNETAYYRHSAFEGRFKRFDGTWYLEITPTYHFTRDGYRPSAFYEDKLTGIKQLETNQALLGQTVMWAEYLSRDGDLFEPKYPLLDFGELATFDLAAGIDEDAWRRDDEAGDEEDAPEGLAQF
jgi:hypothetical protein